MFVKLEEVFGQLNESFNYTGEKEFHKAFAKATGFKTHAGGYFGPSNNSAHIKINLYDCLNYNKHLPRPGVYGDLEIKRVTPMNEYQQAKMDIVYQGVEMECGVGCFYPPRVAKAKNKQVIDLILKQAGIQADYEIVVKNYQPNIDLSEENFNKITKIRVGDKIGDFLVYGAGMADTKSVEQYYIIMTSYKEQFAMHVSKNPAINESYDDIPEYTPSVSNEMNEGMPSKSEALKFAQTFAKFLGIAYKESDDTWNGAGAFFEISQKGFDKAKKKIRKEQGTKQLKLGEFEIFSTGPVVEKLNVDEVEIEDQEGYIRFTKGTKDVYFQSDWAYDDKELLNESTVELNEVTGLPKYKTSVPSHML